MLLIKNGYVINPVSLKQEKADVLIEEGTIIKIGNVSSYDVSDEDITIIDAKGLKIGPGLVDIHVHFRDPGPTYKEDIFTGAKAAAKGGFTSVVLMANTRPAVDSVQTLQSVLDKGKETTIRVESCAAVTMDLKGEKLTDMSLLKASGAAGFTDDGSPIMAEAVLREALQTAKELNVPVSLHEEDPAYIVNNGVNRGKASAYFGIEGADREAEISMIKRDVEIALEIGAELNIQHISTKEGVALIREGRKLGENIHAEATPHHFSLTEEDMMEHGTLAKMNPPLRVEEDRLAIIEGLKDGTIEFIATDHAPHSSEEKEQDITVAPSGIIGLETAFGLAVTNLVKPGYLTLPELFQKMSYLPAKFYHLNAGILEEGAPADLILFEDEEEYTFLEEEIVSRSKNSPFIGKKLYGRIEYTICAGEIIYER